MKKTNLKAFLANAAAKADRGSSTQDPEKFPVLAIDYGEKFCGLAWSLDGSVALPIEVVSTTEAKATIVQICGEKKIKTLIFGLPISGDGSENHICAQIRSFAYGVSYLGSIEFINERGSSQGMQLSKKSERIDDLAAVNILEYWLE